MNDIKIHLLKSAKIKNLVAKKCQTSIMKAADILTETFKSGGKILICGNGGSAADAQHLASEFVNLLNKDFNRPALPAMALTTDTSILTAYANDFGFSGVFKRQIEALGREGDVLLGISTSGNSKNIIQAVKAAKKLNMKTLVLVGQAGILHSLADVVISIPSDHTQYIQEAHLSVEHILCSLVEQNLFRSNK